MPFYEYKAVEKGCRYCQGKFEVRQSMNEEPLKSCPRCGAAVRRLFSPPFICVVEPLTEREKLVKRTPEEAEELGLIDGFAEDRLYEED